MRDSAVRMGESIHDSSNPKSWTPGEKDHIVYKEGKAAIDGYVIDYCFCGMYDFLHSLAV